MTQCISTENKHDNQRHPSTPHQEHTYQERCCKSYNCGQEPSRNNYHHTCYAIYCAITSPCPVNKRRSHCDHKHHIGSRQRQLIGCSYTYQYCSSSQIYNCTDVVVCNVATFFLRKRLKMSFLGNKFLYMLLAANAMRTNERDAADDPKRSSSAC